MHVPADEVDRAIVLLAEFPAEPPADRSSDSHKMLLDLGWVIGRGQGRGENLEVVRRRYGQRRVGIRSQAWSRCTLKPLSIAPSTTVSKSPLSSRQSAVPIRIRERELRIATYLQASDQT